MRMRPPIPPAINRVQQPRARMRQKADPLHHGQQTGRIRQQEGPQQLLVDGRLAVADPRGDRRRVRVGD